MISPWRARVSATYKSRCSSRKTSILACADGAELRGMMAPSGESDGERSGSGKGHVEGWMATVT